MVSIIDIPPPSFLRTKENKMIGILCWIIEIITGISVIYAVPAFSNIKPDGMIVLIICIGIITVGWGCAVLFTILETIKNQISDFTKIDKLIDDKESYQTELNTYMEEMKDEIIFKFKDFEERLMKNISDSKIITTIIEKSGYGKLIESYDVNIRTYIRQINVCDRERTKLISNMKAREINMFDCGWLIPEQYRTNFKG